MGHHAQLRSSRHTDLRRGSRRSRKANRDRQLEDHDVHDEVRHEAATMRMVGHQSDAIGTFVPDTPAEAFVFKDDDFPSLRPTVSLNWQQKLLCPDWQVDKETGEIFLSLGY